MNSYKIANSYNTYEFAWDCVERFDQVQMKSMSKTAITLFRTLFFFFFFPDKVIYTKLKHTLACNFVFFFFYF